MKSKILIFAFALMFAMSLMVFFSPIQTVKATTETRYVNTSTQTVNTNTGPAFSTTQGATGGNGQIGVSSESKYLGIRVFVINTTGYYWELTNGTAQAIVLVTGTSSFSATWSCPQTTVNTTTDNLVISVYYGASSPPTTLLINKQWISEQLGATSIDANTWTVYYYTLDDDTKLFLRWGGTTYVTRVEGFKWTAANTSPTIGQFSAPATTYAMQAFNLSMVANDPDGKANLKTLTVSLNVTSIDLTWTEATNATAKTDANNYADLVTSYVAEINSTSFNVTWCIRLYWNATTTGTGVCTIGLDANTAVVDDSNVSVSTTTGSFIFVDGLLVKASPTWNDTDGRCNLAQPLTLSGQLYYTGTTTAPTNNSLITVYCALNGTVKGSNSSISDSDATFQISITAPNAGSVGTYAYNVYCLTDELSTTNRTASIILDEVTITLSVVNPRINVGDTAVITNSSVYASDGSLFVGTQTLNESLTQGTVGIWSYGVSAMTDTSYGLTQFTTNTVTVVFDRIRIDTLGASDTHANIGDLVTYYATASLEYDGHALGVGDSLTLSGEAMTWDSVDSRFEHNETVAVLSQTTINSFTSGNEAGFGITAGNINSKTVSVIWDALTIFNVQTVQYQGSGSFYYQAQVEWAYDNTTVSGATVGAAYPNGTSIGSFTSNSTGWATFIINQGNVTNGIFSIYGVNDNNYSITVSYSNTTFTLCDWALNTKDIVGSTLSGTSLAVTKGATSIWSGTQTTLYVPADTFAVNITWLQCPVNTTASITISGATSTDFNCTVYPISGTTYHLASNTTVATYSYASEILSVSFSGPTSTYILSVDSPKPTYIINATYNYATDYTPYSALILPHYGNATLKVSFEGWGDLYIQKTTHKFVAVTMAAQVMSITATGTSGDIATVEVYCGSRGNPVSITGWIATTYSSSLSVLSGTLSFASDTTVTLTWVSSGGGGGGGTSPPAIQPLSATVVLVFPFQNTIGTTIQTSVNITWTGVTVIYLQDIYLDSEPFGSWQLLVPDGLPQELTAFGTMGTATIPITLNIPEDAQPGSYVAPCIITFGWQQGAGTKTFRTVSTLEVVVPPPSVPDLMTYWWLLMFAGLGVGMLVLRTRKH
jgi:hypothetical protein